MAADKLDTSVFTDDTGGRRRVVVVAIRSAVGLLGLGAAAVAVSVFGHVKLPGLDAPSHAPGVARHHAADDNPGSSDGDTGAGRAPSPAAVVPVGSSPTTSGTSGSPTAGAPGTVPTAAPTSKATGKPTAKPTTAAEPTHKPTAPPGKPTSKPTR